MTNNPSTVRDIRGARFVNLAMIWKELSGVPAPSRLRRLCELVDVQFHDLEHRFIAAPSVNIAAIGGFPIQWCNDTDADHFALAVSPNTHLSLEQLRETTTDMMGYGGCMTYLNPYDLPATTLFDRIVESGHFSIAHLVSISILVAGLSVAAENEFNSQRDLCHMCRLTVARTIAQDDPPVVVLHKELVPLYTSVVASTLGHLNNLPSRANVQRDFREGVNSVFPAAKASAFIVTSSLRGFQKMLVNTTEMGKELEYRRVLCLIRDVLQPIWPAVIQ